MNYMRRLFVISLALVAVFASRAYTFEFGDLRYEVLSIGGSATCVGLSEQGESKFGPDATQGLTLHIPSTVVAGTTESKVTSIARGAFAGCNGIGAVRLHYNIATVGSGAFAGCSRLSEVTLASSVTLLSSNAFSSCPVLATVRSAALTPPLLESGALAGIASGAVLQVPNAAGMEQAYAKAGCASRFAAITRSVQASDFSVTVTSKLSHFFIITSAAAGEQHGKCTFMGSENTAATNYYLRLNDYYYDSYFTGLRYDLTAVADSACAGARLKSYTDEDATSLARIGSNAFAGCEDLASVATRANVIKAGAFSDCPKLKTLTLLDGVAVLEERCFASSALTNAALPATTATMHPRAFAHTPTLMAYSVDDASATLSATSDGLLLNASKTTLIHCPEGHTPNLEQLPANFTAIGEWALANNIAMHSLSIPASVESIGSHAFEDDNELQELICGRDTPSALGTDVWKGVDQSAVQLYVPQAAVEAYRSAAQWKEFDIRSALSADVNGDGEVTVADVTAIYNLILGVSDQHRATADVNGDGEITVADVTFIYSIILGIN